MSPVSGQLDIAARDLLTTVRYAGASGDFNPLHYDPKAAAAAGFDRLVVHGGWLAAHVESRLAGLGPFRGFTARFERPVLAGQPMRLSWTGTDSGIDAVLDVGGEQRLSAHFTQQPASPELAADYEPLGRPYRWCIEAGPLHDFIAATSEGPIDTQDTPRVPLAFFGNAARWTPEPTSIVRRLGFDYRRMLHGRTSIDLFGPAPAIYEPLWVTEAFANRVEKPHRSGGTMRMADAVLDIADEHGAPRARVVLRILERPARSA